MADTDTNDSPFVVGPTDPTPAPKKDDSPFVVGPTDPTPKPTEGGKYYHSGKRTL